MKSIIFSDIAPYSPLSFNTDVSEEHIASIFRVEEIGSANQRASRWQATTCLVAGLLNVG
jgi:hypothetical protein